MRMSLSRSFAKFDDVDTSIESIIVKSLSFKENDVRIVLRSVSFNGCDYSKNATLKSTGSKRMILRGSLSFNERELNKVFSFKSYISTKKDCANAKNFESPLPEANRCGNESQMPEPIMDRHVAAVKLQKTYKSFRTRRQLADCAVLVEQRWWKLLDFAMLKCSSVSFFEIEKPETAISRWSRARTRAAKVGKGLSKDAKARKLALQHWLEAIDPRHRYGHNLQFYYAEWLHCQSRQPFFYWLDIGEGKEVSLEKCQRSKLQQQCIKYLGPIEREAYEVIVENGKFMYKLSRNIIDTTGGPTDAKWIFVLSTSKILYVGMKQKGKFQHSSFLAGGATLSAGRLVIIDGTLKSVWPHSGHYLPTEENFEAFISFLEHHNVDHHTVKKGVDDDEEISNGNLSTFWMRNSASESDFHQATEETVTKSYYLYETASIKDKYGFRLPLSRNLKSTITKLKIPKNNNVILAFQKKASKSEPEFESEPDSSSDGYETAEEFLSDNNTEFMVSKRNLFDYGEEESYDEQIPREKIMKRINSHKETKSYQLARQLSCRWTTGAGPRIGCVRDYPSEMQSRALEEVFLSPRDSFTSPRRVGGMCRETSSPAKKSVFSPENFGLMEIETTMKTF